MRSRDWTSTARVSSPGTTSRPCLARRTTTPSSTRCSRYVVFPSPRAERAHSAPPAASLAKPCGNSFFSSPLWPCWSSPVAHNLSLVSSIDPPRSASRVFVRRQEGDSSLSGSIEWEDFLTMMKPVVVEEYRKEAEAMLRDTPAACREAAEVTCRDRRVG